MDSLGIPEHIIGAARDVRKRLCALKKLQIDELKLEAEFSKRVEQLEVEFQKFYDNINNSRTAIVVGVVEPADEDCTVPLISYVDEEQLKQLEAQWDQNTASLPPAVGIPNFWMHVLVNVPEINTLIEECDVPILHHLIDITCAIRDGGYTIKFFFAPNEFFFNQELTKTFETINEVDEEKPLEYDGPCVISCKGTKIDWKEGKEVPDGKSFFGFFNPQITRVTDDVEDEDAMDKLCTYFEVGQMLRDEVVNHAVLFYTGEIGDEEESDVGEDEVDDDDDDGDDSDSHDEKEMTDSDNNMED